ncbi:MAG: iron ABC transporter permease [Coriobacteriales bacterium]|nr:iron ABC transporter permease [Coriobacteriales bacterium]
MPEAREPAPYRSTPSPGSDDYLANELLIESSKKFDKADEAIVAANLTFGSKVTFRVKIIIVTALVAVFCASFALGKYSMNPLDLLLTLWYNLVGAYDLVDPKMELVIYNIRLPRIFVVMLVGAALAMAGASFQGMFKNPLTSPDLLGASAGASLGACIALLLNMPGELVQLLAFCGGMVAVGMAVWLNRYVDYDPILGLVLAGILVSTLFSSGMSLVKFMADANDKLPTITFWLMGSFATINGEDFWRCLPAMILGFIILLTQSWKLNVLSFGDEEARAMGINTGRTRLLVIFASTLITSVSVAVAGIVGWIGLVIPHLARAIVGPNYKVLLPAAMFVGAVYLLIVDNIARLIAPVEIPIGILTAILGVPFFVIIFKRNMKGWK